MTAQDNPPALRGADLERIRRVANLSAFSTWCGIEPLACADGYAEIAMDFRPEMAQKHGFLHGALMGYLIDTVSAWAAASVAGDVLTSEYRVHMLAPGIGERFVGRGHVIKASRRQIVTRAEAFAIKDGQEKLIAYGTATIMPTNSEARREPEG